MIKQPLIKVFLMPLLLLAIKVHAQCPTSIQLGSATNMLGVIINETTPVALDNSINSLVFLHRNSVAQFSMNTGHLRYDVSLNAGQTWTNNLGVLNPILTYGARYPNAVLYSPANNTLATNASIGYFCGAIASTWGNVVSGTRQLTSASGTENYNQPGINNYLIPTSIVKSSQGTYWGVDYVSNGSGFLTGALNILKGTWNTNSNDIQWTINTTLQNAITTNAWSYPVIGFDPTGQIGYLVMMSDLNSNGYLSPVIYKTTNSGQNWTGPITVNLNQFSCLSSNVSGSNVAADNSLNLVVDANGAPHIVFAVGKQSGYSIDPAFWHHVIDLTSINGLWTIRDIGNLQTSEYTFTGSLGTPCTQGWSPQAARTSDGTKIFFAWSDIANASLGSPNSSPNLYGRGFDVATGNWTQIKDFSSCATQTSGKILFPHIAKEVFVNGSNYKIAPVYGEFSTTNNDVDITTNYRYLDNCLFASSEFTNATTSLSLTVNPFPNVILCPSSQAQIQLLGTYSQILWSNNVTTSITTVSSAGVLTVTARQGCAVGFQTVSVQQLSYTASSSSPILCSGATATLNAGGNAFSYTWNPGSVNASSILVTPSVTSTYTLIAAGTSCNSSSIITLSVNPLPIVTIVSNFTRTCAGNTVILQASGANLYSWSNGSTGSLTTITPTANTVYSLTAVSALGCASTFTYSQLVDPAPSLSVSSTPTRICAGESVSLTVSGAFSYLWNTGSTSSVIVASPSANTTYSVMGTNTLLCSSTLTVEQKVDPCTKISNNEKQQELFRLFPNPASNHINVLSLEEGRLTLIDGLGRMVGEFEIKSNQPLSIPISVLAQGVYHLQLETNSGRHSKNIIVNKE